MSKSPDLLVAQAWKGKEVEGDPEQTVGRSSLWSEEVF